MAEDVSVPTLWALGFLLSFSVLLLGSSARPGHPFVSGGPLGGGGPAGVGAGYFLILLALGGHLARLMPGASWGVALSCCCAGGAEGVGGKGWGAEWALQCPASGGFVLPAGGVARPYLCPPCTSTTAVSDFVAWAMEGIDYGAHSYCSDSRL